MIDGFKIDVTSDELIGHLRERAEYHSARARAYGEQSSKVTEFQVEDGGQMSYSNNPASSLSQSAENHRKKSAYYEFLADHVVAGETYRLSDRDLDLLGISNPRF